MIRISRLLITMLTVLAMLSIFTNKVFAAVDEEGAKVAEAQFYVALNAMFKGDVQPMDKLWSHADDVVFMGPSGMMQVGWQDVYANWQKQAKLKLGGDVNPENIHMVVGDDIAVSFNMEVGRNIDKEGKPFTVKIRTTNVFRKENGEWKMIGHHTDKLAYLEKEGQ